MRLPIPAFPLLALAALAAPAAGAAELVQRGIYHWSEADRQFGGFSGLAMVAEGAEFLAVTDRGWLYRAEVRRDPGGRVTGVTTGWKGRFLDNKGVEVTDFTADAEALEVAPDGTVLVGFEGYTRVAAFRPPDMMPAPQHQWDRFRRYWGNAAFEALAILPDGGLLAVLEAPDETGLRTVIGRDRQWREGPVLTAAGGFQATGATIGPDGRLYLLERRLSYFAGYATRIRRFAYAAGRFGPGETLLETAPGEIDNMEGISLWRDAGGQTILTLISDDNFLPVQDTLLVEYDLVEAP